MSLPPLSRNIAWGDAMTEVGAAVAVERRETRMRPDVSHRGERGRRRSRTGEPARGCRVRYPTNDRVTAVGGGESSVGPVYRGWRVGVAPEYGSGFFGLSAARGPISTLTRRSRGALRCPGAPRAPDSPDRNGDDPDGASAALPWFPLCSGRPTG